MDAVDTFIIHAELVWMIALPLFLLTGALAPSGWAGWRAARTAREALGELGAPTSALTEGEQVVVEGTLAVEGSVPRVEDGVGAAAVSVDGKADRHTDAPRGSARAEKLVLETPAGRVFVDGPVEVRAGSTEAYPSTKLKRLAAPVRARALSVGAVGLEAIPIFRSVAAGDRVRVRGLVMREAAATEGTYRDTEPAWTLRPIADEEDGDAAVPIVALTRTVRSGPHWSARLRGGAWGAAAFAAVFVLGGAVAAGLGEAGSLDAARVAAATPLHREDGLAASGRIMFDGISADDLPARAIVESLRSGPSLCAVGVPRGDDPLRFAERVAVTCGSDRALDRLGNAYMHAGRLRDASRAAARARAAWAASDPTEHSYYRWGDHLSLHLLAGDLDAAHEAATMGAEHEESSTGGDRSFSEIRAARLRCLALALEHRTGGGEEPLRALRRMAGEPAAPAECALLLADRLDGRERLAVLDACAGCGQAGATRVSWLWRYGGSGCVEGSASVTSCEELVRSAPHWHLLSRLHDAQPIYVFAVPALERELLARLDAAGPLALHARVARALVLSALAEFHMVAADLERAGHLAERAERAWRAVARAERSAAGPERPMAAEDAATAVRRLRALIALSQRDIDAARQLAEGDEGHPLARELAFAADPRPLSLATAGHALERAGLSEGDGFLRAPRLRASETASPLLIAVAARLDAPGRAQLRDRLLHDATFPNIDTRFNLQRRAREVIVSEAFGAPDRAARAEAQALRDVWLRRDTIIPLMVLD